MGFSSEGVVNRKICGKLEEYAPDERTFYFREHHNLSVQLVGRPNFAFSYRFVDYCYNVTLSSRNASFFLQPQRVHFDCNFKVHLPYGNRISIRLVTNMGSGSQNLSDSVAIERIELVTVEQKQRNKKQKKQQPQECEAGDMQLELTDHTNKNQWSTCVSARQPPKIRLLSISDNILAIHIRKVVKIAQPSAIVPPPTPPPSPFPPSVYVEYEAITVEPITSPECAFGWVKLNDKKCVTAIERRRSWETAKSECHSIGARLAAIKTLSEQKVIDHLILNR